MDRNAVPTYAELLARTDAPPGSCWGIFGREDELGAVNFLGPDKVLAGVRSVKRGALFNLDYPLDAFPGPLRMRPNPVHVIHWLGRLEDGSHGRVEEPTGSLEDYLDGFYTQGSSQLDGLRHASHPQHGIYNGFDQTTMVAGEGTLGINRWAERGLAGRAVLIDVAGYREELGRPLDHLGREAIGPDLLDATLAWQGTTVEAGDMVLIRTGYRDHWARYENEDESSRLTAGLEPSRAMVAWLWDQRIPLVAADNIAVERTATGEPNDLGEGREARLHAHLIPLLGMVLGELWKLDVLAADCAQDGAYEFLLVSQPLNLVGGVGSPANATAIK